MSTTSKKVHSFGIICKKKFKKSVDKRLLMKYNHLRCEANETFTVNLMLIRVRSSAG